ncbi:MAG TPA: ABC transporter substrate-binding protein [Actinocrinis sp.]|jgi:peptide/nickel transport system substrate-binding protein|uniref:ABC transporter substrate-binding protein n=1 Tax=Actinocrinis sp. TaxID=1920516 RepID=UPI002DDDA133|nr:ABC transporter substrate-binding protein [Actinocrinis sp.]HEV3172611.1 ABC transporter substrate-binding protein [Actinocrinis sp.]
MKGTKLVAVAAAAVLAVAGCSSTQHKGSASGGSTVSDNGPHKKGGTVTIANEQGQTWTCQFNPFNPAVYAESIGFVYEPLIFVDELNNQAETPMLATGYQWNADKTSIVFTIRGGVKWSDGQPFTADDVAFTFNLMKQTPATDLYALWSAAGLESVTASGNTVTMDFKQSAQPYFYFFADQVAIVPKHIFSAGDAAAHPDTWADSNPVGTGPFLVNPCSANNIQYTANPDYWQAGKPYVQKIEYPAYLDNGPANLDLASGKAQWGSQYIPGIQQFYLAKSADNHTWSPPVLNVSIFPNLDPSHKATSTLAVRQAIATAIDRTQIAAIGEGGEEPPANQSGVVLPTFQKYYDASAVSSAGYDKPDQQKAATLLASAGYSPSHPLNLTVITITGYTDWDASLAVIKQELAPIGINLNVSDLAQQTFDTKLFTGDFDLAYYGEPTGGPTPYYELREMLDSANSAPLGQTANGNYERYSNSAVDTLFNQYATADDAGQVSIMKQVEAAMVRDVPLIPVTESVDWFQYNTSDLGGWPSAQNQYAQPAAFNFPDVEQVLLHLYSRSAQ